MIILVFSTYRYTLKGKSLYVITSEWPVGSTLKLKYPQTTKKTTVQMLGVEKQIEWNTLDKDQGISIDLRNLSLSDLPNTWAWAFEIKNLDN